MPRHSNLHYFRSHEGGVVVVLVGPVVDYATLALTVFASSAAAVVVAILS